MQCNTNRSKLKCEKCIADIDCKNARTVEEIYSAGMQIGPKYCKRSLTIAILVLSICTLGVIDKFTFKFTNRKILNINYREKHEYEPNAKNETDEIYKPERISKNGLFARVE